MKLVISGASGAIGRHFLSGLPAYVRPLALSSSQVGRSRLATWHPTVDVVNIAADGSPESPYALEGVHTLLMLAWGSVPVTAELDPEADARDNLLRSGKLLDAALEAGVRHVVFMSSGGAVYGPAEHVLIQEEHPLRPISAYGRGKLAFERWAQERCASVCALTLLRPGNVYGDLLERVRPQGVVEHWLQAAANGTPVQIWGGTDVVRDYVHLSDMSAAIRAVIDAPLPENAAVYNVGTGVGHTLAQVRTLVEEVTGVPLHVELKPCPSGMVGSNVLDPTKLADSLGFRPGVGLAQGMTDCWNGLLARRR